VDSEAHVSVSKRTRRVKNGLWDAHNELDSASILNCCRCIELHSMLRLRTTGSTSRTEAAIRNTTIIIRVFISMNGDHEFNCLLMQSYLSSKVNDHAYSKKTRVSSKRCYGNTPSSALDR
jgi:hypothetical protein